MAYRRELIKKGNFRQSEKTEMKIRGRPIQDLAVSVGPLQKQMVKR